MSGHQNPVETGPADVVRGDLETQNVQNRTIYEHWQQDRLVEARGVLADIVHHPDTLVVLACRVICTHGSDPVEQADALGVSRLLSNRPSSGVSDALIGGAA